MAVEQILLFLVHQLHTPVVVAVEAVIHQRLQMVVLAAEVMGGPQPLRPQTAQPIVVVAAEVPIGAT